MTMTIPVAQMRIADTVNDAEQALNEALLRNSLLFSTMISTRQETDSDPFLGHEALLRLAKSQQALLAAGGDLARVHGKLLDVQRDITGFEDCPPNEPMKRTGELKAA